MGNLEQQFWPEIARAVVHVLNRLPSKAVRGMIPWELLTGKRADLSHLRVLGCDAYPLDKTPNNKLSPRTHHCILVGYGSDSTVYRLWDPINQRVIERRDVEFNEDGFIREHYMPYLNHYGMGQAHVGGTEEVPTHNTLLGIPPPSTVSQSHLCYPEVDL